MKTVFLLLAMVSGQKHQAEPPAKSEIAEHLSARHGANHAWQPYKGTRNEVAHHYRLDLGKRDWQYRDPNIVTMIWVEGAGRETVHIAWHFGAIRIR